MMRFKRGAAVGVLLCAATVVGHGAASAQVLNWGEEYAKRIKSSENISPLGDDLFGDSIKLFNGTVSFSATDISLPGNNALPVRLTRAKNLQEHRFGLPLGDWDIDAPYVGGTHPDQPSVGYWAPLARCTTVAAPPAVTVGSYTFTARDYWSGTQLNAGGGGDLLAITTDAKLVRPSDGRTYYWTTKGQWFFFCLSALKSGHPGEGFVGRAPDGTTYTFDYMVVAPYPGITKKDPSQLYGAQLNRKSVRIYASKVEDRFGNWVQYDWSGGRLNRIWSSDGREIVLTYDAATGLLASAQAAGRTWTYQYTYASLTGVVNPDGSRWSFAASNPDALTRIEYEPDDSTSDPNDYVRDDTHYCWPTNAMVARAASYSITHPSGASATYHFAPMRHGRTNVKYRCLEGTDDDWRSDYNLFALTHDVVSLQRKVITGPGIEQQTYTYAYSGLEGGYRPTGDAQTDTLIGASAPPHYKTVTVTRPDGTEAVHTFGKDYELNEGQLLRVDIRKAGVTHRTTVNTHVGEAELPNLPFPSYVGNNLVTLGDNFSAAALRPLKSTQITQDGVTFTATAQTFDAQARTLAQTRSSSLGYSRTDVTEYHDDTAQWVLGQVKRRYESNSGIVLAKTDYDARVLPWKIYGQGTLSVAPQVKHTLAYNADGTLASVTDARGYVTTLSTWKRGIPQLIRYPATPEATAGATESAEVNDDGTIASVTDETGSKTCYGYDAMGRLNRITYPSETQAGVCDTTKWVPTTMTFAPVNAIEYGIPAGHWKHVVATGNARRITYYDAFWRPLVEEAYDTANVAGTRSINVKRYDVSGRLAYQSYPLASLTSYATPTQGTRTFYDVLDRPVLMEQDSEHGVLATITDYLPGLKTRITNPRGYITTHTYMAWDAPTYDYLIKSEQPEGKVIEIGRQPQLGRVDRLTQRNATNTQSVTRTYGYDAYQRLCRVDEPETGSSFMGYDAADNLAWSAAGYTTTLVGCASPTAVAARRSDRAYDARNRVTSVTFPDGLGNTTHTYFPDGKLATVAAANGGTDTAKTIYSYNRRRLLTREVLQIGPVNWPVDYAYNANGHLSVQSWHGLNIDYAPNALGQATKAGPYASNASYYPNGALKQFTYGNGIVHTMAQNARHLPARVTNSGGVLDYSYTYDPNGNVSSIADHARGSAYGRNMAYDGLDRLTYASSCSFGGDCKHHFTYDALDNLTSWKLAGVKDYAQYYYEPATHRLTGIRNSAGATVVGLAYDPQGNLSNKNGRDYVFDFGNRLRSVEADGADPASTYVYDGHGRRVRDTTTGSKYSQYTLDGKLIQAADLRRNVFSEYFHLGGSLVAIRERNVATNVYTVKYQHTDALGTPVAVTDASGNVLERIEYDPYGGANTKADRVGYTGHVEDGATGLTYMQQRYYDPQIGRFLSVDPVTADSGTGANFNRYWYADNNPYRFVDPDGRRSRPGDRGASYIGWSVSGTDVNSAESLGMANIPRSWLDARQWSGQTRYGRRPHPSDPTWTRDERLREQMEDAWRDSNPNAAPVARGKPGSQKREQAGWIVQFFGEGRATLVRIAPGSRDQVSRDALNKPSEFQCACRVLGFFHTHPNTRDEGYMPNANIWDYHFQIEMEVPGMIRNHEGYEFIPIPGGQ